MNIEPTLTGWHSTAVPPARPGVYQFWGTATGRVYYSYFKADGTWSGCFATPEKAYENRGMYYVSDMTPDSVWRGIALNLDQWFVNAVAQGVHGVWGEVASDCEASCGEAGERLTNSMAIETVLDADRLTTFGYEEIDDMVGAAIKVHGYQNVAKFLGKNFRLA